MVIRTSKSEIAKTLPGPQLMLLVTITTILTDGTESTLISMKAEPAGKFDFFFLGKLQVFKPVAVIHF